jgi:hypothetical protein
VTRHLTFRVRDGERCFSSCPACFEEGLQTNVGSNSPVMELPPAASSSRNLDSPDSSVFTNALAFDLRSGVEPKIIMRMIGHRVLWERSR